MSLHNAATPSWAERILLPLARLGEEGLSCFRSVQLAVLIIATLAMAVMVGVFMPQEGLVETVKIKQQFGENYHLLKAMGLFTVYGSPWFLTLEVLLFFNILLGSFRWLKPAWDSVFNRPFLEAGEIAKAANALPPVQTLLADETVLARLTEYFKRHGYRVQTAADGLRLLASKGDIHRLGPHIAHTGILLLLVASLYGALTGFKAQQVAVPGQTFSIADAGNFTTNVKPDYWLGKVPDWKVHVKDFRIQFYEKDPTTPQQYYCDLDVLNPNGTVYRSATISVNHPLSLGAFTLYQASFAPTGKLFVEVNGKPVTLTMNSQFGNRPVAMHELDQDHMLMAFPFFVQQDPGVKENNLVLLMRKKNGFLGAAPGKMPENLRLATGDTGTLGGFTLRYVKPEIATGIQMKQAPETPWVYLAFGIISLGAFLCFPPQRQFWVAVQASPHPASSRAGARDEAPRSTGERERERAICVLPQTNKARVAFQPEVDRLQHFLETDFLNTDLQHKDPEKE